MSMSLASPDDSTAELLCTDVLLTAAIDGSTARAHRGVLATYSGVFRHALSPELDCISPSDGVPAAEIHRGEHAALPLPDKTGRELSLLMSFLYPSASRAEQFSKDTIVACMDLAHEYDMPLMLSSCERWLLCELTHGRVVHLPCAAPMTPSLSTADMLDQLGIAENEFYASQGLLNSVAARVDSTDAAMRREAAQRRASEAALTVALLERAYVCGLRTFIATAIDHLAYVRSADVQELLRSPGADSLPAPVLHRLLEARERAAQRPR